MDRRPPGRRRGQRSRLTPMPGIRLHAGERPAASLPCASHSPMPAVACGRLAARQVQPPRPRTRADAASGRIKAMSHSHTKSLEGKLEIRALELAQVLISNAIIIF